MILFAKFSNERSPEYAIRTVITEENGVRAVLKAPATQESVPHIQAFPQRYEWLAEQYRIKAAIAVVPSFTDVSGVHLNSAQLNEIKDCEYLTLYSHFRWWIGDVYH